MEVSRALLEQYLRATGWTCRPRAERPLDPEWVRGEGERMLGISAGLPQLDAIAAYHGIAYATLAYRLGLCAAAEHIRSDVDGLETASSDEEGPREQGVRQASELLRLAGIKPDAWERARQKGGG